MTASRQPNASGTAEGRRGSGRSGREGRFAARVPGPGWGVGWLVVLLVGLGGARLPAQTEITALVRGQVTGPDGGAVAGAAVRLELEEGGHRRSASTAADGRFRLGFVTPGVHRLVVAAEGYREAALRRLRLHAGQARDVRIGLEPAVRLGDTVEVVAVPDSIDASAPVFETIVGAAELELLPSARFAVDLVKLAPGATNQSVWGGSTDQANAYRIDGVAVDDPGFGGTFLLPNVDWIEEVQIRGLGAGARYGGFQGGLINLVTRSGSERVRGALRLFWQDRHFAASHLTVEEVGSQELDRWEASTDVSGPVLAEKLYGYLSLQRSEVDSRVVDSAASGAAGEVTFVPVTVLGQETKLYGKLNWQATPSDSVDVRLGLDDLRGENRGLDGFTAPEAAQEQDSPVAFGGLGWSRVGGSRQFLEVRASGYEGRNDFLPLSGDRPAVQRLDGEGELFVNAVDTLRERPRVAALSASLDRRTGHGDRTHDFAFGLEMQESRWRERRARNGGFTWRPEAGDGPFDPRDPTTWGFISSDWGGEIDLDAGVESRAVWVEDTFTPWPRARVVAGLRWGSWRGELAPGFGGGETFTAVRTDGWAPRLGVVLDLTPGTSASERHGGALTAKLHVGRYHQKLFALLFDRVEGGAVFSDDEYWDWIGEGLPDLDRRYTLAEREELFELFGVFPIGSAVGPAVDFRQPWVDQVVAGLEGRLAGGWTAGLVWVHRENGDVAALVDRNRDSNYVRLRGVRVVDADSGSPVIGADGLPVVLSELYLRHDDVAAFGSLPGTSPAEVAGFEFDQDLVLTNPDAAFRRMDQLQLLVSGRGPRSTFHASLVWTDLVGNFYSASGYGDPGGVGGGSFVHPNEAVHGRGRLPGVSEWEAEVRWTARLPGKVGAGVYGRWSSGEPVTPSYRLGDRTHRLVASDGTPLDPDLLFSVGSQQILLEERGSRDLPDRTVIDLHLDRGFRIGKLELVLGLDVFNVLDEDAPDRVKTTVNGQDPEDPSSLFGAPRRRTSPRTGRISATIRW